MFAVFIVTSFEYKGAFCQKMVQFVVYTRINKVRALVLLRSYC